MDLCQRNIDIIDGKRAKVTDTDGNVYIGKGYQPCVATYKDGEEGDGICFLCDNGQDIIFADDEIASVKLL